MVGSPRKQDGFVAAITNHLKKEHGMAVGIREGSTLPAALALPGLLHVGSTLMANLQCHQNKGHRLGRADAICN